MRLARKRAKGGRGQDGEQVDLTDSEGWVTEGWVAEGAEVGRGQYM